LGCILERHVDCLEQADREQVAQEALNPALRKHSLPVACRAHLDEQTRVIVVAMVTEPGFM
jgi:hypothetical protein